jgi:hypothetical protein
MHVEYVIQMSPPALQNAASVTAGVPITITRQCEMGTATKDYRITTVGQVPGVITDLVAWITADIAYLTTQKGIRTVNSAIKAAWDLAIPAVDLEFDI